MLLIEKHNPWRLLLIEKHIWGPPGGRKKRKGIIAFLGAGAKKASGFVARYASSSDIYSCGMLGPAAWYNHVRYQYLHSLAVLIERGRVQGASGPL
jgi:hypothetical protein